jgi:uncharacterized membrane protein
MRQFAYYSGIVMIIIYAMMGLALIFTNAFAQQLGNNKTYVGVGLIVYAGFRGWMTYKLFRNRTNSN